MRLRSIPGVGLIANIIYPQPDGSIDSKDMRHIAGYNSSNLATSSIIISNNGIFVSVGGFSYVSNSEYGNMELYTNIASSNNLSVDEINTVFGLL